MQTNPPFPFKTATDLELIALLGECLAQDMTAMKAYWQRLADRVPVNGLCKKWERQHAMWIWVLQNAPAESRLAIAEDMAERYHGRADLLISRDLQFAILAAVNELIRRYESKTP